MTNREEPVMTLITPVHVIVSEFHSLDILLTFLTIILSYGSLYFLQSVFIFVV